MVSLSSERVPEVEEVGTPPPNTLDVALFLKEICLSSSPRSEVFNL